MLHQTQTELTDWTLTRRVAENAHVRQLNGKEY